MSGKKKIKMEKTENDQGVNEILYVFSYMIFFLIFLYFMFYPATEIKEFIYRGV